MHQTYSGFGSIICPRPASINVRILSFFAVFKMTRKSLKIPFADGIITDCNFLRHRCAACATNKSLPSMRGKSVAFGFPHSNSSS